MTVGVTLASERSVGLTWSSPPSSLAADSSGWDGGRSNGFVNGYHDNRANGGYGGRGPPRNDRGGRGAYRGNRGGGSVPQPMPSAGGDI